MKISEETLREMLIALERNPIESGGIIGCKNECICAFVFDDQFESCHEYRPNVEYLNREIAKWNAKGISFCGIVHSHLYGFCLPSEKDRAYARILVENGTNIRDLFFPIATVNSFGKMEIIFYGYRPEKEDFLRISVDVIKKANIEIEKE